MQDDSDNDNIEEGQLDPIPSFGQEKPRINRAIAERDALSDTFPANERNDVESPSFIPTKNIINIGGSGGLVGSGKTDGKPSSGERVIADLGLKSGSGTDPGSGSAPFQGYAVQRMPVGLAKDLVSSSTGSGNSGGLGALVGSGGINAHSGSLGTAGSGGPNQLPIGTSQLDMSLNNLFDSLKMKNGPLVH